MPEVLDLSLVDEIEQVTNEEAIHYCAASRARGRNSLGHLVRRCGRCRRAHRQTRPENAGKTIVVVLPDSGERYLSSVLFEGVFDATGLGIAA